MPNSPATPYAINWSEFYVLKQTFTYSDLLRGKQTFQTKTIVRFEASGDYTYLHLEKGKPHCISKRLGEITGMLNNKNFVAVGRSHLVHCIFTLRVSKGVRPLLILSVGKSIPVPRERASKIRAIIRNRRLP